MTTFRKKNMKIAIKHGKDSTESSKIWNKLFVVLGCIFIGLLNYYHVSYMQENNVMFSHLSNLERELYFRTEMGFYYSFYKQVIGAPNLWKTLNLLVNDNLTEYPDTINALKRFNIYPELILGILYKNFMHFTQYFGIQTKTCYMVNRGDLPSVQSCEGLGEPAIFYVNAVMMINGLMMSFFFLIGYLVSGNSFFGAIIVCASYFFNHRECTRVQWTPPLRESFSYPFLVFQQYFLLVILKKISYQEVSLATKLWFIATTLISLLSWQFAQFALLTQCISIYMAYLVSEKDCKRVIIMKVFSLLIFADIANLILQFGNHLLITGPLRPCLIMALIMTKFEPQFLYNRLRNSILSPFRWIIHLTLLMTTSMMLKYFSGFVLKIKSDNHMFDILQSKFSNFSSFDSLLYTCAPEFDFYDISSIFELVLTGLLPIALCSMLVIVIYVVYKWMRSLSVKYRHVEIIDEELCEIGDFYLLFQTFAYIIIAGLIMRLKLFATPQLCIMTGVICQQKWPLIQISKYVMSKTNKFNAISRKISDLWLLTILLAICSLKGSQNLKLEWDISGSYSNWDQEQLATYILTNTRPSDSFTGQMATMATLRLVTGRPIVIHPHYEDEDLRKRVHVAYSVYSKKSIREVWLLLRSNLQAKYLVYEHAHCQLRPSKPGCSYIEMWDIEDTVNIEKTSLCLHFDQYVRTIQANHRSESASALMVYFKWKYTTDNFAYSLFEILDVPQ